MIQSGAVVGQVSVLFFLFLGSLMPTNNISNNKGKSKSLDQCGNNSSSSSSSSSGGSIQKRFISNTAEGGLLFDYTCQINQFGTDMANARCEPSTAMLPLSIAALSKNSESSLAPSTETSTSSASPSLSSSSSASSSSASSTTSEGPSSDFDVFTVLNDVVAEEFKKRKDKMNSSSCSGCGNGNGGNSCGSCGSCGGCGNSSNATLPRDAAVWQKVEMKKKVKKRNLKNRIFFPVE